MLKINRFVNGMDILKRSLTRILPLLLLVTSLIVGGYSFAHAHPLTNDKISAGLGKADLALIQSSNSKISTQTEQELDSSIASGKELNIRNNRRRRRQTTNLQQGGNIQYSLIVQDIVKMFKLLENPDTKPVRWTNNIRGGDCTEGSPCSIEIEDFSAERSPGERLFAGMASKKYIERIFLYVEGSNQNKVTYVEVALKSKYNKNFLVSKIYPMLTDEKFVQINGIKHANCDGPCRGGTRTYTIDVRKRYFPSASGSYILSVRMYAPITDGVGGLPRKYKYGPEELFVMGMQISYM
jgi:hypothetical protein